MRDYRIQKAYLIDFETGEKLEFQYNPAEWDDNREVVYESITIPGISHPVYQFTAGGERAVNFTLSLNSMYQRNAPFEISHWIRARTYPEYSLNMISNAPHKVIFVWPQSISMLAIITKADRHILDHYPDGRIKLMTLDVELKEYIQETFTYQVVSQYIQW